MTDHAAPFRDLHRVGTFLLANACDPGEARLMAALGARAVATTSAGQAATLGRLDQTLSRGDVVAHTSAMSKATDLPLSVDAEDGYGSDPQGVGETVRLLAEAGAAGVSVEDHAGDGRLRDVDDAVARIRAAVAAARASGVVVTARCEGLLYGSSTEDEAVDRLKAYADAGADCVYAPGPRDPAVIARLVAATPAPINVLLLPGGPTLAELADLGVRRVSVGSWFSRAATATVAGLAADLLDGGGLPDDLAIPPADLLLRAWGDV